MDKLISFLLLSTLFLLVGATENASSTIKAYWNVVFPGTPMPNAIRALLPSCTQISGCSRDYVYNESKPKGAAWRARWGQMRQDDSSNTLNLRDDWSKRNWSPALAPLYFLKEDLLPDSRMNITMVTSLVADASHGGRNISSEPTFIPRKQAQEIPFSTSNLTSILKEFSIEPDSEHASLARQTLVDCERPALKGEVKHCATSLESMIDFVVAQLGTREIHAADTSVVDRGEKVKARSYRVGVGGGRVMSLQVIACHTTIFPYAVFYCHSFAGTRAYMVPLIAADDGSQVNAIALCHFDTSNWNPGHASFRWLRVKPGTVPICHFILDDLAWVPN